MAGEETKRAFPQTADFPFHFRKTFTPQSGPIKRGETPEIEFKKTAPIHQQFSREVPEPLGYSQWVYRCAAVCGQTFNALSPFVDLKAELAFELNLKQAEIRNHAERVLQLCELLEKLHASGRVHGDLTLHNAILDESGHAILIDLAGSEELEEMSDEQQRAAIDDDFAEPYRDLILAQYYIGPSRHAHAQKSILRIEGLFSERFLPKLRKLRTTDWSNEIS